MATNDKLLTTVAQFETGMTRVKGALDELDGRKYQKVTLNEAGTAIQFWTSNDTTGTPADTIDFPEEIFLDQLQTQFVPNFTFNAATYPGATNPNLDGKPVFVLAVKGDKETNPHLAYSFINLERLVDVYRPANAAISIAGNSVGVSLSADAGNILSIAADGLLGEMKVAGATQGNIATFGANGAVIDSGYTIAGDSAINAMLNGIFGAGGGNG